MKYYNIPLALLFLFLLAQTTPVSAKTDSYPQKGVCYVSWEKDKYQSIYSDQSLESLARVGVEYIAIVVTYYQETCSDTQIKATKLTPSDTSIIHAIKKAHSLGLKVMLKPHIDLINPTKDVYSINQCRSDIGFTNDQEWEKWFKEYQKLILHYAKMAKDLNVDLFCIGTELSFTTQKDSLWRTEIIKKVRDVYPGKIVYAANWDDYKDVKFWDDLDYIGIDAYFPLSSNTNPTLSELKNGWIKWKKEIEKFIAKTNKPVIFTEIGYTSGIKAHITPWETPMIGNVSLDLQTKCYQSFFETIWNSPWLEGVYWWKWSPSVYAGGINNRDYTPQNKPAQKILEKYYKNYSSDISDKKYTLAQN
ncbi:conserved hypothetical protein, secreted [Candidatus Omnitrophus magneticus]|uniref:Secreted protein n=1 Tax=Candidatus Omnitrophus magneticus TaxID=1609969 RepID=A0A0F0CM55_9BACT|nr:conserved hypothetical protein, secreted [Candidatus Omnitrophus magneticus]